jgi:hypothetical protein
MCRSINRWLDAAGAKWEAHLKLDRQVMDALRKSKAPVVAA